MKPLLFWFTMLFAACSMNAATAIPKQNQLYTFQHENVLGTSFELKVAAPSEDDAAIAEAAALSEIDRLAKILSGYDSSSEFRRWLKTSGSPVRVSAELFEVLSLFDQWRAGTGGALDASAETVSRVWRAAASEKRLPSSSELAAALQMVQQPHWKLDPATRTATHLSDALLMLNSFTKSWIVDRAVNAALAVDGVNAAVINIGGDIVVRGDWNEAVSIADPASDAENSAPLATLRIANRAVATSGKYRRGYDIAGVHYSHIVDPRTGRTADEIMSATVVASSPSDAGALATAFCVLTPAESQWLAARIQGVDYLIVKNDGTRFTSRGWTALAMAPAPPDTTAPKAWNGGFELSVSFELSLIEGRARRPYVAVWIEDKDKFSVRTLALWYQKPRWLPDLRAWNHADRIRSMAEGNDIANSISSATRPPGKYTLKWDGKDNTGKLVKAGRYTVCIEAAREHGTYQIIRHEMDFSGVPGQITLPGNVEVASASLDYHKAVKP